MTVTVTRADGELVVGPEPPADRPVLPPPVPSPMSSSAPRWGQLRPVLLVAAWLAAVAGAVALVSYGFGPLLHAREQRSLLERYRTEIDRAVVATSGLADDSAVPKAPEVGAAVALLEVEALELQEVAVEGVGASQTRVGPGHVPGTAGPGQPGNSVIVGRRAAFGGPFDDIDRLSIGDDIVVTTTQGRSLYEVTEVGERSIGSAGRLDELYGPSDDDRLTLVTSASSVPWATDEATAVVAEMRTEPFEPTPQQGRSDHATGRSGDQGAVASVALALLAYATVMGAAVLLYRRLTPMTAYVLSIGPVVALTVVAAETMSRLFPAWM